MIVLLAIGFCLAPPVFKASNRATIEKPDPGGGDLILVVVDELQFIADDLIGAAKIELTKLEAVMPLGIEIEPTPAVYQEWKPFGQVNTKYHAAWLFHPLKLC